MKFIYCGNSWAYSSYPLNQNPTNLAKEWKIPHIDLTINGGSNLKMIDAIKKLDSTVDQNIPIVCIYGEPSMDVWRITGISFSDYCELANWNDIRNECNRVCLETISSLDRRVLLIGGHSDVIDCNHSNITIAHPSWQKWMAEQAGMVVDKDKGVYVEMDDGGNFFLKNCWAGELVQIRQHEQPELRVDAALDNSAWDTYYFWKELEKKNWFSEAHPSVKANKEFAQFLLPEVIKFLNL